MILELEKNLVMIWTFIIALFVITYRLPSHAGTAILMLELVAIIVTFNCGVKKVSMNSGIILYVLFCFDRIVVCGLLMFKSPSLYKSILYKELMLLMVFFYFWGISSIQRVLTTLRNVAVFLSFLGCIEFYLKKSLFTWLITRESLVMMTGDQYVIRASDFRVKTVFIHPIPCAIFATITWFLLLFFPIKNSICSKIAKLMTLLCLIGTQTRSSWVAFILFNAFYIIMRKEFTLQLEKRKVWVGIGGSILILAAVFCFYDKIRLITWNVIYRWNRGMRVNGASRLNRVTQLKRAIYLWRDGKIIEKILGYGDGYMISYLKAHSIRGFTEAIDFQYAETFVDNGIVGAGLIIAMVIFLIYSYQKYDDRIVKCSSICCMVVLFSGFFMEIFGWIVTTILFCMFLAMNCRAIGTIEPSR